ncbi:putative pentatricopeptide repeat-containing protein At3g15130 [Tripterygium wilfordii]|uniref:putative pentatricopeptide repeat-containing protein At3g15130 n=1 Tax=Tripterygium wilfordii TaxID=458696 RepID=UPI0018F82FEE|nr:putative pentatricopeptide repeat-containing protein At3g15130 [Tripterygium wilfordii]
MNASSNVSSRLWHTFYVQRAAGRTHQLISRALTTCNNGDVTGLQEDCDSSENYRQVDLDLISQLQHYHHHGCLSNPYFLNKTISCCARWSFLDVGIQVHSTIVKLGFTSNLHICTALVDMYGKCSEVKTAHKLFNEMPERNVVTWNSLIYGYMHVECPEVAVQIFIKLLRAGLVPSSFSFSTCLAGCAEMGHLDFGTQVHGLCLKAGFSNNVVVGTVLIDMYSKGCNVEYAKRVFDCLDNRNVVTWTSVVTGYANNGEPDVAMLLAREMLQLGIRTNYVTYNCLLTSFSSPSCFIYCKQVHCRIILEGLESNMYIEVTLLTAYSKCSDSLEDFLKVCSTVTWWEQISWNAVIGGFCNLGYDKEAFKLFSEMRQAGICVDLFSFTSILGSIGNTSALQEGKQTHVLILKTGYASNMYIQNGLVSMYARSGAIEDAKRVFISMDKHDVISWNSLLSGCAHHGYGKETIDFFEKMKRTEVKPDSTTYLALLSACSHSGFLDKGLEYFDLMRNDASVEPPRIDHYASVVSLFGRAGYLNEAEAFINSMPIQPGLSVYKALLSGCQVHGNKEIAGRLAKQILELWPDDHATYVLISNLLAKWGSWDDAAEVREASRWSPHTSPTFASHHDAEDDHGHHHKKSVLAKVKERAKKWRHSLSKKKHGDEDNTTPSWGVSLDDEEDDEEDDEGDPEYLGAPMYESELASDVYKETARQHPRADPVIPEKHVLSNSVNPGTDSNLKHSSPLKTIPETVANEKQSTPNKTTAETVTNDKPSSPTKTIAETLSEKLAPAYATISGATHAITNRIQGLSVSASPPAAKPTLAASAPATTEHVSSAGEEIWDKGVSMKEYIMHKFEPGEDERALSQVISEAMSPKKTPGSPGVVDMVREAVSSLLRNEESPQSTAVQSATNAATNVPIPATTNSFQNIPISTNAHHQVVEEENLERLLQTN